MFERSPDYFQKFSNSFRYIICDTVPDFTNFSIKIMPMAFTIQINFVPIQMTYIYTYFYNVTKFPKI